MQDANLRVEGRFRCIKSNYPSNNTLLVVFILLEKRRIVLL